MPNLITIFTQLAKAAFTVLIPVPVEGNWLPIITTLYHPLTYDVLGSYQLYEVLKPRLVECHGNQPPGGGRMVLQPVV